MSEMVDRVARAIHKAYHADTMDGRSGGSADAAWDRLAITDSQDEWRAAARAAIAAMREPTEAMRKAAADAVLLPGVSGYQAMIDAALKDDELR